MTFPFPTFCPVASGPDAYTSLLLHFDGSNGATTFADSSMYGQAVSRIGTIAALSTADKKFGTASLRLQSNGCLQVADTPELRMGSGDFTIDWWAKLSVASEHTMVEKGYSGAGAFIFAVRSNNLIDFWTSGGGWSQGLAGPAAGTWQHYAIIRSGSTLKLYIDGVEKHSRTDTTNFSATGPMYIGAFSAGSWPMNGFIDEFRVSKGIARWTSAFTPPSAPY